MNKTSRELEPDTCPLKIAFLCLVLLAAWAINFFWNGGLWEWECNKLCNALGKKGVLVFRDPNSKTETARPKGGECQCWSPDGLGCTQTR